MIDSPLDASRGGRNAAYWAERRARIASIARIVQAEEARLRRARRRRDKARGLPPNGRRRPVWCVELRRAFPSLSAAAAYVDRAPCHVLSAARKGGRCGGFHWRYFDPAAEWPAAIVESE